MVVTTSTITSSTMDTALATPYWAEVATPSAPKLSSKI